MSNEVIYLNPGPSAKTVKVHPFVLINIIDHYIRRNENQTRVIGTLLGTITEGTIEIKNSFPVPHTETEDTYSVAVDIDFHNTLFALNQRVHPKEVIVGWYSTGSSINMASVYIHDFYAKEAATPVHLLIDVTLSNNTLGVYTFIANQLSMGDKLLGSHFSRIKHELKTHDAERVGAEAIIHGKGEARGNTVTPQSELQNVASMMKRLVDTLDDLIHYCDKVIDGKVEPDNAVGHLLLETMSQIPALTKESFEQVFHTATQDVLLVSYLGSLMRSQTAIAEKLALVMPPPLPITAEQALAQRL
mmetsp:Transcript_14582/g.24864  ORF Transcript_14582/g.24864 Transcript_14582/m.24864 type:complete len:303 (+) Transcript_14582:94-1002(+)